MTTNPHYWHKMLLSAFGGWECRACGQGGDERTNPQDHPCVAALPDKRECICEWDESWSASQPYMMPQIVFRAKDCPFHGDNLDDLKWDGEQ